MVVILAPYLLNCEHSPEGCSRGEVDSEPKLAREILLPNPLWEKSENEKLIDAEKLPLTASLPQL